jgi:hypothetical protein
MPVPKQCDRCGASLDWGERCDCQSAPRPPTLTPIYEFTVPWARAASHIKAGRLGLPTDDAYLFQLYQEALCERAGEEQFGVDHYLKLTAV